MTTTEIENAVNTLTAAVRHHYGDRLHGLYRVERGNLYEIVDRCDAEIAVVLSDSFRRTLDEQRELGSLTFDVLSETGVYIRAWPVSVSEWKDPALAGYPEHIVHLQKHAHPIMVPA